MPEMPPLVTLVNLRLSSRLLSRRLHYRFFIMPLPSLHYFITYAIRHCHTVAILAAPLRVAPVCFAC